MKHNFVIRIYQDISRSPLGRLQNITISGITLLSKPSKFSEICIHKGNQNKFGYTFKLSKKFSKVSGSNSAPSLSFKGDYIDITVNNFPRYPAFYQSDNAARDYMNGWGYTNYVNDGFPSCLLCRKIEIII